jgi:hypothetical protein
MSGKELRASVVIFGFEERNEDMEELRNELADLANRVEMMRRRL